MVYFHMFHSILHKFYSLNVLNLYMVQMIVPQPHLIHYFVLIYDSEIGVAIFYTHFMPLLYLQGPMIYFYVSGTIKDEFSFNS
jgi:hypothetical protein